MPTNTLHFLQRLTYALLSIFLLGYLLILGKTLLAPLLFALLFALLLLPFSSYIERKLHAKRAVSALLSVLLTLIVIYGIGHFFFLQLRELWADWPLLVQQVTSSFHDLQGWIVEKFHVKISQQESYLADGVNKILSNSTDVIGTTISTLSSSLLFLAFTLLFTFFLLNYRRLLFRFILVVFDAEYLPRVSEAIREIQTIIKRYTVGLFLQMLIVSTMTILVLSVLEVKYAILLGLVAGVFNIIPYLGISAAAIISTLITFATIGSAKAVFVLLAFAGIHTIDSNIIMPLIVGAKVKINALIAFIGIVLGEMIWGIQGMFLCMPYLAIIKTIFKKIDSMQPWAILLDEDEQASHNPSRFKLIKQIFLRKNSK